MYRVRQILTALAIVTAVMLGTIPTASAHTGGLGGADYGWYYESFSFGALREAAVDDNTTDGHCNYVRVTTNDGRTHDSRRSCGPLVRTNFDRLHQKSPTAKGCITGHWTCERFNLRLTKNFQRQ